MNENITAGLNEAFDKLREDGQFNGIPILELRIQSVGDRTQQMVEDGELTGDEIDENIKTYCCCGIHLDYYDLFNGDSEYTSTEFDRKKLEDDLREFFSQYVDPACIPYEIDFEGGDNEFIAGVYPAKEQKPLFDPGMAFVESVARSAWRAFSQFKDIGGRTDTVGKFDDYVVKVSIKPRRK